MTYYVKRTPSSVPKNVKTHIIWTHSNVESDNTSMDFYHSPYFRKFQKAYLCSHGLELTEELKVDGVLTLRVLVDKYEIIENSFNLVGCPIAAQ